MTKAQSQYELFQEWLNDCPVQIESYQDNVDSVNCYFNPDYYNNPMYFSPLTYEVINND